MRSAESSPLIREDAGFGFGDFAILVGIAGGNGLVESNVPAGLHTAVVVEDERNLDVPFLGRVSATAAAFA